MTIKDKYKNCTIEYVTCVIRFIYIFNYLVNSRLNIKKEIDSKQLKYIFKRSTIFQSFEYIHTLYNFILFLCLLNIKIVREVV